MTGLTFITVSLRVSPQLVVGQVVRVLSKECGDDGTSSSRRMRTRFTQGGGSACGQRLASLFSTVRARVASCPVRNRLGDQIRLTRSSTRMVPVASATA